MVTKEKLEQLPDVPEGCLCDQCNVCKEDSDPVFWKAKEFKSLSPNLIIEMTGEQFRKYIHAQVRPYVFEDDKGFYITAEAGAIICWTRKTGQEHDRAISV